MYINKKGTILIYILVLISLVMIMAVVVLNNSIMLENAFNYQTIKSKLANKIKEKWSMLIDYDIKINSDWSWFLDNISCPDNITMCWATMFSTWVITRRTPWTTHICSWTYNSMDLIIYPNATNTTFSWAKWWPDTIILVDGWLDLVWWTSFPTYDSGTYITIPKISFQKPDWIDDDFNSDNYNWD